MAALNTSFVAPEGFFFVPNNTDISFKPNTYHLRCHEVKQYLRKAVMTSVSIEEFEVYFKTHRICLRVSHPILNLEQDLGFGNNSLTAVDDLIEGLNPLIYIEWNRNRLNDLTNASQI